MVFGNQYGIMAESKYWVIIILFMFFDIIYIYYTYVNLD